MKTQEMIQIGQSYFKPKDVKQINTFKDMCKFFKANVFFYDGSFEQLEFTEETLSELLDKING